MLNTMCTLRHRYVDGMEAMIKQSSATRKGSLVRGDEPGVFDALATR